MVKPGDRIVLDYMPNDPDPIPPGTTGTVIEVTPALYGRAGIQVQWDIARSLSLIEGVDQYRVIDNA